MEKHGPRIGRGTASRARGLAQVRASHLQSLSGVVWTVATGASHQSQVRYLHAKGALYSINASDNFWPDVFGSKISWKGLQIMQRTIELRFPEISGSEWNGEIWVYFLKLSFFSNSEKCSILRRRNQWYFPWSRLLWDYLRVHFLQSNFSSQYEFYGHQRREENSKFS